MRIVLPRLERIIPARAGFTTFGIPVRETPMDHPRSRGVYRILGIPYSGTPGSSPLARGLPMVVLLLGVDRGIIPARAGFTRPRRRPRTCAWDHPRSRGVYRVRGRRPRAQPGSSPLARGLRSTRGGRCSRVRIIPARAGFTASRFVLCLCVWDHLRSRGVYPAVPRRPGLPRRIIPARAGFTK